MRVSGLSNDQTHVVRIHLYSLERFVTTIPGRLLPLTYEVHGVTVHPDYFMLVGKWTWRAQSAPVTAIPARLRIRRDLHALPVEVQQWIMKGYEWLRDPANKGIGEAVLHSDIPAPPEPSKDTQDEDRLARHH